MRPGRWSVARQLLALQVLLLTLIVVGGAVGVVVQARRDTEDRARDTVLALAKSIAASPFVLDQARGPEPSRELQPYAERVRHQTGVDFVVIMNTDRTRYTHPNPALIGKPFVGTIAPALAGRTFTETYTGSLGPSVRAVAPVTASTGRVVALVAVGITKEAIGRELGRRLPALLVLALLALLVALAGAVLVSRRLRRQTHGLGAAEITRMYEYYDSVLHAVREGLILLDRRRRVQLVNNEARRLLGLAPATADADGVVGAEVARLDLGPSLGEVLANGRSASDELHVAGERVLVVSQAPAVWDGHTLGTVATLRDSTELLALTGELDSTPGAGRVAPLAGTRGGEPAAHRGQPDRAGPHGGGGRVRHRGAGAGAAAHRPGAARDQRPGALGAAARQGSRGQRARGGARRRRGHRGGPAATRRPGRGHRRRQPGRQRDRRRGRNRPAATGHGQRPGRRPRRADPGGRHRTGPGPCVGRARVPARLVDQAGNRLHGRGLGLALVGQVVRRLGGTVGVRREAGAVFTVWLPAQPAGPAPPVGAMVDTP